MLGRVKLDNFKIFPENLMSEIASLCPAIGAAFPFPIEAGAGEKKFVDARRPIESD